MDFFKLLKLYDFDPKKAGNIVLVRHIPDDDKPEVAKYIKHSPKNFEMWQRIQCKENPPKNGNQPTRNQGAGFWKCNTIVSFCGAPFYDEKGMHARFAGVFHNHSGDSPEVLDTEKHLPEKLAEIYRKRKGETLYFFRFHKNERFKDLEGRVVVNLSDARNWVKPIEPDNNKGLEVREVLPRGYVRSFPGIENFTLPFAKLKNILENHTANREWHTALSSVAGIYAIRCKDKDKHKLYIGKASGKNGIIGRWQNYADNGHGGNEELKNLSPDDFQFSVLQALSKSLSPKQVAEIESRWKEKLGTRNTDYGANRN